MYTFNRARDSFAVMAHTTELNYSWNITYRNHLSKIWVHPQRNNINKIFSFTHVLQKATTLQLDIHKKMIYWWKWCKEGLKWKKKTKDDQYIFCKTISNYKLNLSLTQHKIKNWFCLEVFLGKGVLKICSKVKEHLSCQSLSLCQRMQVHSINCTWAWVFSCKFAAYFQNTFPKNTYGWLLLMQAIWCTFQLHDDQSIQKERRHAEESIFMLWTETFMMFLMKGGRGYKQNVICRSSGNKSNYKWPLKH